MLTLIFGFVVAAGGANVWLMAALLFSASTFFNAMQPIAHAMVADIAPPEQHGAAFGMNNLIGEIGAVLSPAVSGAPARRDRRLGGRRVRGRRADRDGDRALPVRQGGGATGRGVHRKVPADPPIRYYGCVVDRVNVSVLLYVPVRSGSLAPIDCLNSIEVELLDTGAL